MTRFQKECDGMPRDELEKRFVALQEIAELAHLLVDIVDYKEDIPGNATGKLHAAFAEYGAISHDD